MSMGSVAAVTGKMPKTGEKEGKKALIKSLAIEMSKSNETSMAESQMSTASSSMRHEEPLTVQSSLEDYDTTCYYHQCG